LPVIAQALGVAMETLVGEAPTATRKRGPAPKLQQQMDRITQLPKARQQFVMQAIDSMLTQSARRVSAPHKKKPPARAGGVLRFIDVDTHFVWEPGDLRLGP
jgi:hypothetical protein